MSGVSFVMTGDEKDMVRAVGRADQQIAKLKQQVKMLRLEAKYAGVAAKDIGDKAGDSAKKGAQGFRELLGAVGAATGGIVGIGSAIGVLRSTLAELSQMRTGAGARITDAISGRRALAQIATTSTEYQGLIDTATRLRGAPGMTAAEAYGLTFAAGSAGPGFLGDVGMFAKLREIGFAPTAGIEAGQKLQAAFGGEAGAGTSRAIINKVLAAAGPSPVYATDIARAASTASVSWAGIGGGDEALLAMLGVVSEATKTPLQAGEKLKSLAVQISKKRHLITAPGAAGMGGMDILRNLQAWGEQGYLVSEAGEALPAHRWLGEANAAEALRAYLAQAEKIERRIAMVTAAQAGTGRGDILGARLAMVGADPASAAVAAAARATGGRETAEEMRYGSANILAQAIIDESVSAMRRAGVSEARIVWERRAMQATRWLSGDDAIITGAGVGLPGGATLSDDMANAVREFRAASREMPRRPASLARPEEDL